MRESRQGPEAGRSFSLEAAEIGAHKAICLHVPLWDASGLSTQWSQSWEAGERW